MSSTTPTTERPPVVAIMGHIDHGKSTLLDYIRKSNIVAGEAGGITQHISAYEVAHKDEHGALKKITFIDTPGHEAFSKMRERGAQVADIALLIVSAEDGVKTQTKEAWETIVAAKVPFIVVINKIDKPGANVEKTKMDLVENGIYIEGYGGTIPVVEVSAKAGTGVDTLLSTILLVAELESFTGNPKLPAEGFVIEANMDPKRGISGTLIIKNGTLKKGMTLVVGNTLAGTRLIEDFLGKQIQEATFSSPIHLIGFDALPQAGSVFFTFENKKDAEKYIADEKTKNGAAKNTNNNSSDDAKKIPIILKTDVSGTGEAIEKELRKLEQDSIKFKIISQGVGAINESDLKLAGGDEQAIVIGFNVKIDPKARDINEKLHVAVETFDIIYKLLDWLRDMVETRRPRVEVVETTGIAKIIKAFSRTKERQVIGGHVESGTISVGNTVKIMRRDFEIGQGKIIELQHGKIKTKSVESEQDFGMMIEAKPDIAHGDTIHAFTTSIQ